MDEPESDELFPIKLTIADYELLAKAGTFPEHGRTELIVGQVFRMSPQFRPHGFVKDRLFSRLDRAVEALNLPLTVASEQSVSIPSFHQPQPDLMLISQPSGNGAIPVESVALIIEVSDSSSRYDYRQKTTIYPVAGVSEYWIVDIVNRQVRQLWRPIDGLYEEKLDIPFGGEITSQTIPGLAISTEAI